MRHAQNKKHAQQGFTLIELMIIVAIIGILAAAALPQYSHYVSRAKAASAMAELDTLKLSMSECYQVEGSWTNCVIMGAGTIPTVRVSEFVTIAPTISATGVITAMTAATLNNGTPLTTVYTPSTTIGQANMIWANSGTVCNAVRGMKVGQGGC